MRAQPQPDLMVCDQCLEPFPETEMVPLDVCDGCMLVCRKCWRELRRSDKRKERA